MSVRIEITLEERWRPCDMLTWRWGSALPSCVVCGIECRLPPRPQGSGYPPRQPM